MVSNYYYTPIILQPLLQKAPDFPSHCPNYKGSDCLNFLVHLVSINNCQKKLSKAGFPCCHWKDCFLYWTAPGRQCCSKLLFREYLHHHKESSVHHEESKKKKKHSSWAICSGTGVFLIIFGSFSFLEYQLHIEK